MGNKIDKLKDNDPTITEVTYLKEDFKRKRLEIKYATTKEIKQVCEALQNNKHVVKLEIGINSDESLQSLTTLLANNKFIKTLILGIGEGVECNQFWEQIRDTSTLIELFVTSYNNDVGREMKNALYYNFSIINGTFTVNFFD